MLSESRLSSFGARKYWGSKKLVVADSCKVWLRFTFLQIFELRIQIKCERLSRTFFNLRYCCFQIFSNFLIRLWYFCLLTPSTLLRDISLFFDFYYGGVVWEGNCCYDNEIDFKYLCVVFCEGVISCFVRGLENWIIFLSDNDRKLKFSISRILYHGLELLERV